MNFSSCFTAELHKLFPRKKRERDISKKDMFVSAPKSEPSDIFLTCSFLLLGSIFPASQLTDAVCMWDVFLKNSMGEHLSKESDL